MLVVKLCGVPYDDSVRINLENQALLGSGWHSTSLLALTMINDHQNGKD
jgi:hypothetical protein